MPLKIALHHNLPAGGAKRSLFEKIKRLKDHHSIDLFTLSTANKEFCNLTDFVGNNFSVNYSPLMKFNFPLSRLNWIIQIIDLWRLENALKKLADKINKGGYDLCFLATCQFTDIPLIICHIRIPTVYYAHSTIYPEFIFERRSYLKSKCILIRKLLPDFGQVIFNKILERKRLLNINKARLVLTNSYFMKEQLYQKYGVWTKVNYQAVDIEKFVPISKISKENFVLSVGALQFWKGHDFIIESLSCIPESKRPDLIIAYHLGLEQERGYLINLAKKLRVNLTLIEKANVVELYNRAKVTCFAAIFEPLGRVPLESMACATPVVAVKEGGIRETVAHQKTGLLVQRDPKEFAQAIRYLLENDDIAKKYGKQGREYVVKNWSWKKSVSELEKYFYDVISNK
jgi:glycosyltransferase involved in cell wall biosynthesis